ncbi:MAG: hypothetical protein AAF212_01305 [Verrucomicrobiota bacterium]
MDVLTNYLLCILCVQIAVLMLLVSEKVESTLFSRSFVKGLSIATSAAAVVAAIFTLLRDVI